MKKILLFLSIILLTGCSNYTCTKSDDTGLITNETLELSFKNEKVKKISQDISIEFNDLYIDAIDDTYDTLTTQYKKYKKKEGYKVSLLKENNIININLKINLNKTLNKSVDLFDVELEENELIKDLENKGYSCE